MSYKEQGLGVEYWNIFPWQIRILSYEMEGIGEGMFEVDYHARSVTIFRTACFQGLAVQICLQGNEGIVY